jgi:hypothetical protein
MVPDEPVAGELFELFKLLPEPFGHGFIDTRQ